MSTAPYSNLHHSDLYRSDLGIGNLKTQAIRSSAGAFLGGAPKNGFHYLEDFFYDPADLGWDDIIDTGSTTPDAPSLINCITTGVNNDETYTGSGDLTFNLVAGKKLFFEARVKLTEPTANEANIVVGLNATLAANLMQDDGAGPASSIDQILLYKLDGEAVWRMSTSDGTTQNLESNIGSFSSGDWQRVGFAAIPADGNNFTVYGFVDDVLGGAVTLDITSVGDLRVVGGVKSGAAEAQTLNWDYVAISGDRP